MSREFRRLYLAGRRKKKAAKPTNVIPFQRQHPLAKQDFQIEDHGSIVLLKPLTEQAVDFVNENIGKDNGFQPYYPVVLFEPRYVADYVDMIRAEGLLVR